MFTGKRLVCKLLKSLYGLKQAPVVWRGVIHSFILSLGFNVTDYDKCIYYRCTANIVFFLAIHVDDCAPAGGPFPKSFAPSREAPGPPGSFQYRHLSGCLPPCLRRVIKKTSYTHFQYMKEKGHARLCERRGVLPHK